VRRLESYARACGVMFRQVVEDEGEGDKVEGDKVEGDTA